MDLLRKDYQNLRGFNYMPSYAFILNDVMDRFDEQTKLELVQEIDRLKEYNAQLENEVAWRSTLDYVEQEARKFGMAKPDEVKYQFTVPGAEGETGPEKRIKDPEIGY